MTLYAKIVNDDIEYAPANLGAIINFNKNEELLKENGYMPVLKQEQPEFDSTYQNITHSYQEIDGQIVEQWEVVDFRTKEEAQKEHIQGLKCTKRVFALCLQKLGVSYTQLKELIATNENAQLEWDLCVELQRSNELIDLMASQLEVTSEQIDNIFLYANGEINEINESITTD